MNHKIIISIFFLFLLTSTKANANETSYGIGVGVGVTDSVKIYFPIRSSDLKIEPSISIVGTESKSTYPSFKYNQEITHKEIGIGLFKNKIVTNEIHIYLGTRFGYSEVKLSHSDINLSSAYLSSNKESGYFVTPTFGVQYHVLTNFSIGLEVGFTYLKTDGGGVNVEVLGPPDVSATESDTTVYSTEAGVIMRYSF